MITSKLGNAIGLEIKDLDVTKISDKETINTIEGLDMNNIIKSIENFEKV